jgi:flagellar hook-associated protein 3 FlgL
MSGSINATGQPGYGFMNVLIANAATVNHKLDTLTNQVSTGLKGTTYAGLGSGAQVSLDLSPQIAHANTWSANIDAASGNMQVTQTAMTQIQQIANSFYGQMPNLSGTTASEIDSVAASARSALQQVAGLLDTQNGNTYVFAGQDSANPPVPTPDNILTSGFYTQINAAVAALGTNGAAATAATTLAVAGSNAAGTSPFSASQSQPAATLQAQIPTVSVGQGSSVAVGLLASANASITSTGTSTTGSYTRDLMRALATIGSLSSNQAGLGGYSGLISDTTTSLGNAITAMASDAGNLGNTQASLTATQTTLSDTVTALTTQVSSAQDVNMASTLSQLQLVQTQMQSSYQLIANYSNLSLVKFLPVA